ncbi:MAG: glycosyltransferase family 39 protein [Lentisphaeria bacterium]|nr:glycosyltransferase family 39 protein [Lentisphaeria bacterium]
MRRIFSELFDHPAKALFWFIGIVAVLWSVQCTLFQSVLGKDIVETVMWGAQGQLGHLKHPPLSGWIGYAVAVISGYSDFAMYLTAQLFLALGTYYVYKLAREFWDETESAAAALLLYVLFYYNPSSMKFCSHFLEAAFMPPMVYYIVRGAKEDRLVDWLLAGFFTALAVMGKYSAVIVLPGCLVYILLRAERRKCFLRPGVWCGMLLAFVLLIPHLIWLVQHDFCCIRHIERRVSDDVMPWYYFLEVAGVGLAPVACQWIVLYLVRLPNRREDLERRKISGEPLNLALLLTLIPVAVLTLVALSGEDVVLMWYSFLAAWTGIAALALFPWRLTRSSFRNLWLLTVVYTVIALTVSTLDIVWKSRLRCHADPAEIVKMAERFYQTRRPGGKIPAVIGERWICGVIQFYSPEHPQAFCDSDQISLAPFLPEIRKNGALLLGNPDRLRKLLPELTDGLKFEPVQVGYKARFGKRKEKEFFIAFYPGESPAPKQ